MKKYLLALNPGYILLSGTRKKAE
ncbi:uncharacterized protein METZ01_LOCUS431096, partial [marine metagenome]